VLARIKDAEILDGYLVKVTCSTGEIRVIDMKPYLFGPAFEDIFRDINVFRMLKVDPELGAITWPNGVDICPDVLYYNLPAV